jgi:hypothetical protein
MRKFAPINDLFRKPGLNFLSYEKDSESAGYILKFYDDPQKSPINTDWFLDLESLLLTAENDYGIEPDSWKD